MTLRDHPRLQRFGVPPEWVFDAGLGELFVVRVAGNILSPEIAGEPAVRGVVFADTVVRGTRPRGMRGDQRGASDQARGRAVPLSGFNCCWRASFLAFQISIRNFLPKNSWRVPSKANVRWTVRQVLDSPEGQAGVAEGRMKIVGAVYEIETGRVRFLSPDERT